MVWIRETSCLGNNCSFVARDQITHKNIVVPVVPAFRVFYATARMFSRVIWKESCNHHRLF